VKLLGKNTVILEPGISLADAVNTYPHWFAVILDPEKIGTKVKSGSVCAVSKTHDGAFRALDQLGQGNRRATVTRLP
jgi:hypothetical protein